MRIIRPSKMIPNPDQYPLISPDSDWEVPAELPDLTNIGEIALDTETNDRGIKHGHGPGWATGQGYVAGVGVAWRTGTSIQRIYVPVNHPDTNNFPKDNVARWVGDITKSNRVVMFNAGYDVGWLHADMGVPVPKLIDDASCAAFLIDENREDLSLDGVCKWRKVPGKDLTALREAAVIYGIKGKDAVAHIAQLPARYAGPYGEQDPASTLELMVNLRVELEAQNLGQAYATEMRLIPIIHAMRKRGIRIDIDRAEALRKRMIEHSDQALLKLSSKLGIHVGMDDVRSHRWLVECFKSEGVPYGDRDGKATFERDWMRRATHFLPRLIAEARQCRDMADKFIGAFLLNYASAEHGNGHNTARVHASINQWLYENGGTRSHRLSYADPPLQQAPSRPEAFDGWTLTGETAIEYRNCFLPEEGELWFSPDYCHDAKTEILTESGWIKFPELGNERIYQWHEETGLIDLAVPKAKYIGPLRQREMVRIKSKRVDACVTGDHRVLLRHRKTGETQILLAKFLTDDLLKDWWIPQRTETEDDLDVNVSDDMLRLIIACQADAQDRANYGGSTWVFHLTKQNKIERLKTILCNLKIDFHEKIKTHLTVNHKQRTVIRINDHETLRSYLGFGKIFNSKLLMTLSLRQRKLIIEELMEWDGSGRIYGSASKQNVDVMSAVGMTSGYLVQIHSAKYKNRKPFWFSYFLKNDFKRSVRFGVSVIKRVSVNRVYCVTMPSGFIVTRRNGRVMIGGQSQQEYRLIVADAERLKLPRADVAGDMYRNDPKTDFHNLVVQLTGLPRRHAKDCNFAKSYGAGVPKFAAMTNKTLEEAEEIMNTYDRELPFVKALGARCDQLAQSRGYIRLFDGARCHFDRYEVAAYLPKEERMAPCSREEATARQQIDGHPWQGARLKRAFTHKAMNRRIQGNAARQMKLAMVTCGEAGHIPILTMHDELAFSLDDAATGKWIAETMATVYKCSVPFLVDADWGTTWGDAKGDFPDAHLRENRPGITKKGRPGRTR